MFQIIDFYLNQLSDSRPSPQLKTILENLISELKHYGYPNIEMVDIISIRTMLDYILSDAQLIYAHQDFIKKAIILIDDILGDGLYVKIEPKLIALEDNFRKNIAMSQKQIDDKLTEEIKLLITEKLSQ